MTAVESAIMASDQASAEFAAMVERTRQGVVQIRGRGRGGAAGIIWRTDGMIMTNHHVIAGNGGGTKVLLADGRTLPAQIVASNEMFDLALLRVDARDLPAVPTGDSTQLRVGELVFAVGHPWGQRDVVTAGIVSGLGAVTAPNGDQAPVIRSDARLAPGNSGGPLVNARGELIGINAMVFGGDMGVAIPSHVAQRWEASLQQGHAYLGVSVQPAEFPAALRQGEWAERRAGLLVVAVVPDGPALQSVLLGDLLIEADETPLDHPDALLGVLGKHAPGDTIQLRVVRAGVIQSIAIKAGKLEPAA